jgi:hypothetical protein
MPALEILGGIAISGLGPLLLNWLEGRRRLARESEKPDAVAEEVVARVEAETPLDFAPAPGAVREAGVVVPEAPRAAFDHDQAIEMVRTVISDPATRAVLGLPRQPRRSTRIAQGCVTAGMVAFIVYALATKTETGLAFAFMGSIGGFWLREFAA